MEEKVFTIPLRHVFEGSRLKRAKRAITAVRTFLTKHMKAEDVSVGKSINEAIWARGIQKPPRRVRVHAIKDGDVIFSELIGVEIKTPSKEQKEKKGEKDKKKDEKIKEKRKMMKQLTTQQKLEKEQGIEVEKKEEKVGENLKQEKSA